MKERVLFLTGRLAQSRLEKVLQGMAPTAFDWTILNVGVKVAALMTEPILMRRLPRRSKPIAWSSPAAAAPTSRASRRNSARLSSAAQTN